MLLTVSVLFPLEEIKWKWLKWLEEMILCAIFQQCCCFLGGAFSRTSLIPPTTPSLSFFLRLNLPGLSTSMQIWNVNDHPEGQTKKVNHFHAMLNMQILWQIKASRHAIKLAS